MVASQGDMDLMGGGPHSFTALTERCSFVNLSRLLARPPGRLEVEEFECAWDQISRRKCIPGCGAWADAFPSQYSVLNPPYPKTSHISDMSVAGEWQLSNSMFTRASLLVPGGRAREQQDCENAKGYVHQC